MCYYLIIYLKEAVGAFHSHHPDNSYFFRQMTSLVQRPLIHFTTPVKILIIFLHAFTAGAPSVFVRFFVVADSTSSPRAIFCSGFMHFI